MHWIVCLPTIAFRNLVFAASIWFVRSSQSDHALQLLLQALQIKRQGARRLLSLLFVFTQRLCDDSIQLSGHFRMATHWSWFVFQDRYDHMTGSLALERDASAHHLVK